MSLVQVERNEKALRKVQEKIMRVRSTVDWSQSNNILSCFSFSVLSVIIFLDFVIFYSSAVGGDTETYLSHLIESKWNGMLEG